MYQVTNYINGKECFESNESISIINPSYGTNIGEVLYATKDTTNNAINAAAETFITWSKTGLSYRAELILKLRQGIINKSEEIIDICIKEAGKTRPDAEAELDRAVQALTHIAGVQHFYPSIMSPNVAGGIDITDVRYPIGVVVGCGPFNFPILIPILHASMAIVTGNTFIAKPSEKVPSISRLYADIFKESGFPDGCYNVLNGGKEIVEQLVCHEKVAGLAFIGSTPVAKSLKILGVQNNTKIQALGGGKKSYDRPSRR